MKEGFGAGGKFLMCWPDGRIHIEGEVVEWLPPRRFACTWVVERLPETRSLPACLVTYEIEPASESVRLTMTEAHSSDFPDAILSGGRAGWPAILSSLKSLLETGKPLSVKLAPPAAMLEAFRGIIWLLFANALGFVAANSMQRSQRKEFAQSLVLQQLLSTDALTGIPNRRRFDETLSREWRRCARARAPLSLLMIDIDHFKAYNDHCGHQQGDECLRQVARLLVDAVGRPGDLVARYGGEEFVCLLPEVGQAGARAVAARLIAALHRAAISHPNSALSDHLTVCIGVGTAEVLSGAETALFALADQLLYAAKNAGRNRFATGQLEEPRPALRAHARAA